MRDRPSRLIRGSAVALAALLLAGCTTTNDAVDDTEEESAVPDDAHRIGIERGTIASHGGLRIGLTDSRDGLASADITSGPEGYYESRMEVGRRVVVGIWEIELVEVQDDYSVFDVRDHDRDPAEPVALRPPGGTRNYPPGFTVHLTALDDASAQLEVQVRTGPDAAEKRDQWQEELVTLEEGSTVEVHGYGIAWHERRDDELLVTITRPDGSDLVPSADATGDAAG